MTVAHTADRLAREASIELSCMESGHIRAGRDILGAGRKTYVSHLPRQTWMQTWNTCAQLASAGLHPVPHLPARLVKSEQQLEEILSAIRNAGADDLLLIAGDYAQPLGPYHQVLDVIRSGKLHKHGFTRVSLAGHPEGHPSVPANEIWLAQLEKTREAASCGLEVTLVTQFFFEASPFIEWARDLREAGVTARLVAGLPGPASIVKLLALAKHCGVGPSIRALSSRPKSMLKLLGDRSPDSLMSDLVAQTRHQPGLLDGIHVYSFGGFLRTAAWLREQSELQDDHRLRGCNQ
jgi:methylenetetrahydrofolate reductase (NADPH)